MPTNDITRIGEETDERTELEVSFQVETEHGDVVLEGHSEGVVME